MLKRYVIRNKIEHAGILKMQWGVRRFQNPDGTLTEAGKLRYSRRNEDGKTLNKAGEQHYTKVKGELEGASRLLDQANKLGTGTKSKTIGKKDYSNISDKELKAMVNRMNMEEQYAKLVGDTKKVRTGEEWVHELLNDAATIVGMAGTAVGMYLLMRKVS